MKTRLLLFSVIAILLSGWSPSIESGGRIPFQLNNPDRTSKLDDKLKEISGLTWYEDDALACVNDEEGIIYVLNSENGEITKMIHFAGGADYEGITYAEPFFYISTSSGTLFQVYKDDPQLKMRYNTPLNWTNDVEGLAYDSDRHFLLMACKEEPGLKYSIQNKGRAVYDYDLLKDSLIAPPKYIIKKKHLEPFLGEKPKFKPSGIAIDPFDCNIYVLASIGKLLIMLSPDGTVIDVVTLDDKVHRQPEGIAFSPDGSLYISNEGRGKKARLHKFNRIKL